MPEHAEIAIYYGENAAGPGYSPEPAARGPSGDDASMSAGLVGVGRDGFIGVEVHVALDERSKAATDRGEFREADVAKFRASEAKIAEAKLC